MQVAFGEQEENITLKALQGGDEKALERLYLRYYDLLFRQAYGILKDRVLAEDIIQDTFMHIWQRRETLSIRGSIKAYLQAMVRYQVFHSIKNGQARPQVYENLSERMAMDMGLSPQDILEEKELIKSIAATVDTLPERCKEVYIMSREQQLTHKEIAEQLNISTKTVENQITKALHTIKNSLKNFLFLLLSGIIAIFYIFCKKILEERKNKQNG
ncbi:RNA polymerase sigma-70 factor [Olivibacter sitiensis]|uniref:RNA polymerase sigma-70 factor n=1 Tax=Olivibacter sitiensis TaxID=376470 RepID=UPI000402D7DA|nr:RNA polymerase sigma-70 factor [Olivibacter sitiensis]